MRLSDCCLVWSPIVHAVQIIIELSRMARRGAGLKVFAFNKAIFKFRLLGFPIWGLAWKGNCRVHPHLAVSQLSYGLARIYVWFVFLQH